MISGTAAQSVLGKDLNYAIVGEPQNVTTAGLAAIQGAIDTLRDPQTPEAQAQQLAEDTPAILWVDGSPHGGEESGGDASLKVLYDLAARTDCAAEQILDDAIVIIVPIYNPDGRDLDQRRNFNGFDMNRDWFARTQPEIDGVIELMRQYPPQLAIDAHEMGTYTYFFPPNADPVYHEIPDQAIHWINDIYGPAMAAEFDRQKIPYFNFRTYDFFGIFYGDTVPATGFHAAGMTFEKSNGDPIAQRVHEHYTTIWTCLSQAVVPPRRHPGRVARLVRRRLQRGRERHPRAERRLRAQPQAVPAGAEHEGSPLLPAGRRPGPRGRGPAPGPPAPADGRGRLPADRTAHRSGLQAVLPTARPDDPPGRDLLDPDGPGAEAVDPGDAARGPVHRVQHHVRRVSVEQPAADERPGRLVGARPEPAGDAAPAAG